MKEFLLKGRLRLLHNNGVKLTAKMTESLSIQQAIKLVLLSQRLPPAKQTGKKTGEWKSKPTKRALEYLFLLPCRKWFRTENCYRAAYSSSCTGTLARKNRCFFTLALHKELSSFLQLMALSSEVLQQIDFLHPSFLNVPVLTIEAVGPKMPMEA